MRGALHYEIAWFETLPLVALTMTRILGGKKHSHGEERALRARLGPRTTSRQPCLAARSMGLYATTTCEPRTRTAARYPTPAATPVTNPPHTMSITASLAEKPSRVARLVRS